MAIPNAGGARASEYSPWYEDRYQTSGAGDDAYLDFLIQTVKPLIDRSFPSRPERAATAVVGSSLGGLISLYAVLRHGDVFGLAGVMSPALRRGGDRMLPLVEDLHLPVRIHLDAGGREWRGMLRDVRRLRDALLEAGLVEGRDLQYVEERHAIHREDAWARRLPDALRFLLAGVGSG